MIIILYYSSLVLFQNCNNLEHFILLKGTPMNFLSTFASVNCKLCFDKQDQESFMVYLLRETCNELHRKDVDELKITWLDICDA